jgi:hypothetical protein
MAHRKTPRSGGSARASTRDTTNDRRAGHGEQADVEDQLLCRHQRRDCGSEAQWVGYRHAEADAEQARSWREPAAVPAVASSPIGRADSLGRVCGGLGSLRWVSAPPSHFAFFSDGHPPTSQAIRPASSGLLGSSTAKPLDRASAGVLLAQEHAL